MGAQIDEDDVAAVIRSVTPDAAALRPGRRSPAAGPLGEKLSALLFGVAPDADRIGADAPTMTGDENYLSAADAVAALHDLAEHLRAPVPAARPSPAQVRARLAAIADGLGLEVARPERSRRWPRRGPMIAGVAALVVALAATAVIVVRIRDTGLEDPVLVYETDFSEEQDWRTGAGPAGVEEYAGGGYELRVTRPGFAEWVASPAPVAAGVRVTAVARLLPGRGEGGWGVWCRGSDADERYEFSLTMQGYAYIAVQGEEPVLAPIFAGRV